MIQQTPSKELLELMRECANSLQSFVELWQLVKEQGQKEGYTVDELRDLINPFLKARGLTKDQRYYLFHLEQRKQDSKDQYKSLTEKSRNITTNDDKNDTEDLSINNNSFGLDDKINEYANSLGLPGEVKKLIANKRLKDHPKLQRELVENFGRNYFKDCKEEVAQTIHNVETGYYEKLEDGSYIIHDGLKENVKKKIKPVYPPIIEAGNIQKMGFQLLKLLTNQEEFEHLDLEYLQKVIENTKDYRLNIVKVVQNEKVLSWLETILTLVSSTAIDMAEMINKEYESRDMKKELTKE